MSPELQDGVAVPAIIGMANRLKVYIPEQALKWMPLVVVALGLVYAFSYRGSESVASSAAKGLTIGLAAAGGYDGARALFRKKGEPGDTTRRLKSPTP